MSTLTRESALALLGDSTPPVINNLTLNATTFDLSENNEISVLLNASDDQSGFDFAEISYINLETGQDINLAPGGRSIVSGDLQNGTFADSEQFSTFAASGQYVLERIEIGDNAGNDFELDSSDPNWQSFLDNNNIQDSFEVINPQADSLPPVINNLTLNPTLLDLSETTEI